MRATPILGSLLTAAALLVAGCKPSVSHVAGDAAPVTAAPAITTPASVAPPSTPPSSAPPSRTPTGQPTTGSSALVLGPDGAGALKLGMTRAQASATGLITAWKPDEARHCYTSKLKVASDARGTVWWDQIGVSTIVATADMRTPEGIHTGSTRAAVLRAYPSWKPVDPKPGDPFRHGYGFVTVPGNSQADYRISIIDGKVEAVSLQDKHQGCYE